MPFKLSWLTSREQYSKLISQGKTVAFVGIGVAYAPVITRSHVGVTLFAILNADRIQKMEW